MRVPNHLIQSATWMAKEMGNMKRVMRTIEIVIAVAPVVIEAAKRVRITPFLQGGSHV